MIDVKLLKQYLTFRGYPADAERWNEKQLDDLQRELNRLHMLDLVTVAASDAIGSLRFDKVDLGVDMRKLEKERFKYETALMLIGNGYPDAAQLAKAAISK